MNNIDNHYELKPTNTCTCGAGHEDPPIVMHAFPGTVTVEIEDFETALELEDVDSLIELLKLAKAQAERLEWAEEDETGFADLIEVEP